MMSPVIPVALADLHRQAPGALEQDAVEDLARNRHRVIPVPSPPSRGRIGAAKGRPVGGDQAHPAERRGAGRVHVLQHAQPVQQPGGLRRQVLAADLRAQEPGPVQEHDRQAALGEENGRCGPRGAGPDHGDVHALHGFALTAHCRISRGYRITRTSKSPAFSHKARTSSGVYARSTDRGPSCRDMRFRVSARVASQTSA